MRKKYFILSLILAGIWIGNIFPDGKEDLKIALIYPSSTKDVLYKTNPSYNPTEEWELFFLSQNYNYEVINDYDIDEIGSDINVLVIPSMEVVSDDMIDELNQLLEEGKGILLTGNFADYDEEGNKRTGNHNNLPDFEITKFDKDEQLSVNHFLNGNTPFSEGLKSGQKILLSFKPLLYYARNISGNARPEGSYMLSEYDFPGIVSEEVTNGRLLWFGFNLSQIIDKHRDLLISNSLKWLSSRPEVFINNWPGNSEYSVVLYKNLETVNELDSIKNPEINSLSVNYFVSPNLLEKYTDKLKALPDSNNIDILWDDFRFSQIDVNERTGWLENMRRQLSNITEQRYSGISSYGQFKDFKTLELLRESGYQFILSSDYSDSFLFDFDTTNNFFLFYRSANNKEIQQILKSESKTGGIFCVNEDSAGQNFYSWLSSQNCWIPTFSELIDWIEKTKDLNITIEKPESSNYEINIKNNNAASVSNAKIWISIPHLKRKTFVMVEGKERELTFDHDKNMYYLILTSIRGYQEVSIRIPVND